MLKVWVTVVEIGRGSWKHTKDLGVCWGWIEIGNWMCRSNHLPYVRFSPAAFCIPNLGRREDWWVHWSRLSWVGTIRDKRIQCTDEGRQLRHLITSNPGSGPHYVNLCKLLNRFKPYFVQCKMMIIILLQGFQRYWVLYCILFWDLEGDTVEIKRQ